MLFSPTTIAQYIQFIYKNANLVNATLSNTCSTLINVFVYNYIFIVKKNGRNILRPFKYKYYSDAISAMLLLLFTFFRFFM